MISAYIEFHQGDVAYYIDLGTITSVSNSATKQAGITPIVSRPASDSFPVENSNSQGYSLSFVRKDTGLTIADGIEFETDGITLENSKKLSNKRWYELTSFMIDRWQARTNGCMLHIKDSEGYYYPEVSIGCIQKTLSRVYSNECNEIINGSLSLTVGTMYLNQTVSNGTSYEKMDILISDSERNNWYLLYAGGSHSCISSVKITGGSESPFEMATIKISRKKLQEFVPDFNLKSGIKIGKNQLYMDFMGKHTMDVVQVKSGDTITIKAYCRAWIYFNSTLPVTRTGHALYHIEQIFNDTGYGITFTYDKKHPENGNFKWYYPKAFDDSDITFPAGTNVWRILQICSMIMGCKLYFCDDKAYLIAYSSKNPSSEMECNLVSDEREMLDGWSTKNYALFKGRNAQGLGNRCVGATTVDNEGTDPLANKVTVICKDNVPAEYSDPDSIATYKEVNKGTINISEIVQSNSDEGVHLGDTYAQNYIEYLKEPQRSITFKLRESFHVPGDSSAKWASFFGDVARLASIEDYSTGELITNNSTFKGKEEEKVPQKLVLSNFVRSYPEGICEYTFGTIANIDLSSSTSQITTALNIR